MFTNTIRPNIHYANTNFAKHHQTFVTVNIYIYIRTQSTYLLIYEKIYTLAGGPYARLRWSIGWRCPDAHHQW